MTRLQVYCLLFSFFFLNRAGALTPCFRPATEPLEEINAQPTQSPLRFDARRDSYYEGESLSETDTDTSEPDEESNIACVFHMPTAKSAAAETKPTPLRNPISCALEMKQSPIPEPWKPQILCALGAERAPANSEQIAPEVDENSSAQERVLGSIDSRIRVLRPTSWPWRVNGHLSLIFNDHSKYVGSGTLVGPRHVLTAAHNLYDRETKAIPEKIIFYPGESPQKAPWVGTANTIILHPRYRKTRNCKKEYDIGMVILEEPLGEKLGHFGLMSPEEAGIKPETATIAGYPGNPGRGRCMYWMEGGITGYSKDGRRIFYDIDTSPGQSGSGVWVRHQDPSNDDEDVDETDENLDEHLYCIASHSHGASHFEDGLGKTYNNGTYITPALLELLETWLTIEPTTKQEAHL